MAKQWTTTEDFILNGKLPTGVAAGRIIRTEGYYTKGDGGAASWISTGNIITASQSPADLGDAKCSDASGNEFEPIALAGLAVKEVNVLTLGADKSGVASSAGAFKAAAGSSFNTIAISDGTYNYDATGVIDFFGKTIIGAGIGRSVISFSAGFEAVNIGGDGVKFTGVTLLDYATCRLLSGDDMCVSEVEIDNSSVDLSDRKNGFFIEPDQQLNGLVFENNYIHDVGLAFFTDSSFGSDIDGKVGYCYDVVFKNNRVARTRKAGFSFNADGDAYTIAENPWKGVVVSGNTFKEYLGDDTLNRPVAIGGDWMSDMVITYNVITGYGRPGTEGAATNYTAAIHVEDNCDNITITNNQILDCLKAIEVYETTKNLVIHGNILEGNEGHTQGDDPSAFNDPSEGYSASTGISYSVVAKSSQAGAEVITSNKIKNFENGILLQGTNFGGQISGNTVELCSSGIQFDTYAFSAGVVSNTISQCKYMYSVASNAVASAMPSKNTAVDCYDIVIFLGSNEALLVMPDGFSWATTLDDVPTGVNTYYDLIALPGVINAKVNTIIRNTELTAKSTNQVSLTYDGTTMSATKDYELTTTLDTIKVAGTSVFVVNSDRLDFRVYSSVGATADARCVLSFDGYVAYSN